MQVEDFRGARTVPLVVFPADGALPPPPRLGAADGRRIGLAVDALDRLRRCLEDSTRRDGRMTAALADAAAALRALAVGLAPRLHPLEPPAGERPGRRRLHAPTSPGGNEARPGGNEARPGGNEARPGGSEARPGGSEARPPADPHDVYMGVRRGTLTPESMAAELAVIVHRAMTDLAAAPVDVNEVLAEAEAVAAVLARLARGGQEARPAGTRDRAGAGNRAGAGAGNRAGAGAARAAWTPSGDGLERWVLVHHLYGVFQLHATSLLSQAAAALDRGDRDAAVGALDDATVHLRGATAAMLHAGAVPAAFYRRVIRPTMRPPAAPMHLGGSMNPENARLRAAMARLLERSHEPFEVLASCDPELALARDALLTVDLLDIERHVAVAAVLVGDEHSLLQHERSPDNAVGILRRMRHERAVRYCPLMRWGDRAVLEPAPLEVEV